MAASLCRSDSAVGSAAVGDMTPQGLIVEAAGITPATGPFVVTKAVPNVATLRGFQFVWQAADLDATGIVAVSNPSPSFVR